MQTACDSRRSSPPQAAPTAIVPVGSWQGSGNRTIGFVSDSGRFRITWKTDNELPAGSGTFRLTVHSAVSGRPLETIADHRGVGSGTTNFADDPRHYNVMVESANVEWSVAIEEFVVSR